MIGVAMNIEAMRDALRGSERGELVFQRVVGMLIEAGVESYNADLVSHRYTYYMPDGETHIEEGALAVPQIAEEFSADKVVAAIRAAQADAVRYPEFLKLAAHAGVVSYRVFLTGKRAVYLGRKGEMHVEEFPRS